MIQTRDCNSSISGGNRVMCASSSRHCLHHSPLPPAAFGAVSSRRLDLTLATSSDVSSDTSHIMQDADMHAGAVHCLLLLLVASEQI
jgi:hypothetical protein